MPSHPERPCARSTPNPPMTRAAAAIATARTVRFISPLIVRGPPDFALRQRERDVLARIRAAADGDDDVLTPVDHVGHRVAALLRRHPHRPDFLAGLLVVRAQHRAAR